MKSENATTERVEQQCGPAIEALGYELVKAEYRSEHGRMVLRLFIDHPDGVRVDDCTSVSRLVGDLLDAEDVIGGRYVLEVSSPGLDRPLTKPEHFHRFAGETVKLQTQEPLEGRRRFTGRLVGLDGEHVVLDVDGESARVPLAQLERANVQYQFD